MHSFFIGFAGGIITPMRLGEYVGRAASLKGADAVEVMLATFIDKFLATIIVTLTGLFIGSMYFSSTKYFSVDQSLAVPAFVAVFFLSTIVFLVRKSLIKRILAIKILKKPLFCSFIQKVEYFSRLDGAVISKVFLFSFFYYCAVLMQFGLLTAAFTGKMNIAAYASAGALVFFIKTSVIPFSVGDLGVREGASIFFLGFMGVSASQALNASISLYFLNVLLPATIGLPLFFRKNKILSEASE
jgi:uncharacterized membrane protein YbhN (UPF0104 family)